MSRRVLAIALACLLGGVSLRGQNTPPGQTTPLGVVTQSALAHLNSTEASVGTSVYDNDRLETGDKGALGLHTANVQLLLMENSALLMNHDGSGLTPTLHRGTVYFRVENGTGLQIHAADVHVRPRSPALTIGVTAGKETKTVEEGKSYRVALEGPCAATQNRAGPIAGGHSRFLAVPVVVGAVTIWAIHEALESPDRP